MRRAPILLNYKYNVVQWDLWDNNEKKQANFNKTRGLIGPLLVTKNQNIIPRTIASCSPHFYLRKGTSLSLSLSLSLPLYSSSSRSFCLPLYLPPSTLPSLVSELLSLSLSLPELTTQEVTTDSINSSYINPAIIAPPACLSAPSLSPPLSPPHPLPPSSDSN